MAACIIHKPGDHRGPCKGHCQHEDCAQLMRDAETPCPLCGFLIGYDADFYRIDGGTRLAHAKCWERDEADL